LLEQPLRQAVMGSIHRSVRNNRPRFADINWDKTIRANLQHYQPQYRTIIPHRLIGDGRKGQSLQHVILCVDQSGSMASSVVYSSIAGAVLASIPALSTHMVVFDTEVVDLTAELNDPVDLLFGVQLGGGTDINKAIAYCQQLVTAPNRTTIVLISDLYEGGDENQFIARVAELIQNGIHFIALLALSDEGSPSYSASAAKKLASLGIPVFGCTPAHFPSLMAAALQRQDLFFWLQQAGIAPKNG
jgi:Mg-chelatase subunit ChlD